MTSDVPSSAQQDGADGSKLTRAQCLSWVRAKLAELSTANARVQSLEGSLDDAGKQLAELDSQLKEAKAEAAKHEELANIHEHAAKEHEANLHTVARNYEFIRKNAVSGTSRVGRARAGVWEKWRKSGVATAAHDVPEYVPKPR